MKKQFPHIALLLIWSLLWACSTEDPITPDILGLQATGDEELLEFLKDFEQEAKARGITLTDDSVSVEFVSDLEGDCTRAYSNFGNTQNRRVEVEQSVDCWSGKTSLQQETVMFREFGRAILSRPYANLTFPFGYPRTIMCFDCNEINTYYHPNMRDYYLDELFDPNTPLPDWAILDDFNGRAYRESFDEGPLDWEEIIRNDENNEARWKSSLYKDELGNGSLRITTDQSPEFSAFIIVQKQFDTRNIADCSGLQARVLITFNEPMRGDVAVGLSARRQLEDGTYDQFVYHIRDTPIDENDKHIQISREILCLPEDTEQATISFHLRSEDPVDVSVDNVIVEFRN
ncbi:MAG: hypothetical protein R8G66_08260 [Cytophagales bacterium]|nr:hypothetical protein [Cytophagales bacterium]